MTVNEKVGCPRCRNRQIRVEYQGREGEEIAWTVLHCLRCSFTWRDSEPATTIVAGQRDQFFTVDARQIDKYPIVLPPGLI